MRLAISSIDLPSGETLVLWDEDQGLQWRGNKGTISPVFTDNSPSYGQNVDDAFRWLDNRGHVDRVVADVLAIVASYQPGIT